MIAGTRRRFLAGLAGFGAAAVSTRGGITPLHAEIGPTLPLRLPETAMRLERLLERGVGDAAAITVRRAWAVQFARQGRGVVVTGQQITAEVSAPSHLSALAKVEQQRDTSAMFPLLLTDTGIIIAQGNASVARDTAAAALQMAEAMIARTAAPDDARIRYRQYLAQIHSAGASALDTLPADLLFPTGTPVDQTLPVALPGGMAGQFALRYTAQPQADAPWLARAQRQVTTTISGGDTGAGLTRSASEVWILGPLSAPAWTR